MRRVAYNWALAEWKRQYDVGEKPYIADIDKRFNRWKQGHWEEKPWLYAVPSCCGQQAIKYDLKNAMRHFFRRVKQGGEKPGFPRFKKRGIRDSVEFTVVCIRPKHIQGTRLLLPKKMGLARLGDPLRYAGKLMSTTVSRSGNKWYAAFAIEVDEALDYPAANDTPIGVDVGVAKFAALSDGTEFEPIHAFKKMSARLARAQRKLSRMEKFSNNWKKQQKNIRAIHASIKHMRNDYANQVSAKLTEQYGQIYIEDLAIRNMSQSAKGTADAPGKNVKAKTGLNRAILDQGWYRFRVMLEYKSARHGGQVIAINPQYTSQRCSVCDYIDAANRKTQAAFVCQECGHAENADINAARNILQIGLELSVQTQKT